jgi:methylmalonyl-CoA mutase
MKEKLFSEFDPVSSKQWKQKIQFELNGADYNEKLVWESPEGIKIKPFYNKEDTQKILKTTTPNSFHIGENCFVFDVEKTMSKIPEILKNNTQSLILTIENPQIELIKILEIIPNEITTYLNCSFFDTDFLKKIDAFAQKKDCNYYVNIDPIGHLAENGNWYITKEKDNFEAINLVLSETKNLQLIGVRGSLYQNAGANIIQQIAYMLAHANEYMNRISSKKQTFWIQITMGSNYFFEISKIRALRYLFDLIAKEYEGQFECRIVASPSKRNKTIYNYQENLLKTQSECEAAALGGANAVCNLPHDSLFRKSNYKSANYAKNQLIEIKEKCHSKMMEGNYLVESLTVELAEKSLELFKKIEREGGFLSLLKNGSIQEKIAESAQKEQIQFDTIAKDITTEKLKNKIELYPFLKMNPRKIIVKPILPVRLAEKAEKIQLASE